MPSTVPIQTNVNKIQPTYQIIEKESVRVSFLNEA